MNACRICFEDEEDEARLVSPCDCRGSQKFVHLKCLRRWQSAIQLAGNPRHAHFCQVCQQKFTLAPEPPEPLHSSWPLVVSYGSLLLGIVLVLVAQKSFLLLFLSGLLVTSYCLLIGCYMGVRPMLVQDDEGHIRLYLVRSGRPVPGLYAGQVLLHRGPRLGLFGGSVVLLVSHSSSGTLGFILNKAMTDEQYLRHGGPSSFMLAENVYRGLGGPVTSEGWTTLHIVPHVTSAVEVAPGIYMGGSSDQLQGAPPGHVKVVYGAACWAPQQLDGEIRAGSWTFLEAPPSELFSTNAAGLWDSLSSRESLPVL